MVRFISAEGDYLVDGTSAFLDRIGYHDPDFDAGDYAVRNLGFVEITHTATGALKLRFRPDLLNSNALEGTFRFLARHPAGEICIEHFDVVDDRWITETGLNPPSARDRILLACSMPRVA